MEKHLKKEIENLIQRMELNCSVEEFPDKVNWDYISSNQVLSEDFIREFADKVNWVEISYNLKLSEDFIREFAEEVDWDLISFNRKFTKEFLQEFKNKVHWTFISFNWKLSEDFIREFADKVDWNLISSNQKLSEEFIREFKDKVDWYVISRNQKLSEEFIREFAEKFDWDYISKYQILSKNFIKEFKNKINIDIQLATHHDERTLEEKRNEMKNYAKKYRLEFNGESLIAYRKHDKWGKGQWNKTISYKRGKYYKDWRCNLDSNEEISFGFGIWPNGNTKVEVKVEDWGVEVDRDDGKGRVYGFKVLE